MAKYKLTNFLKESHPANDQWLEAFKDALGFETLISPSYLMDKYGHLRPEEAAQLFMNDSTATQMAKDKEKFSKETGLEEDVNPYKISNRLFDHTARTANIGSTGEELHFNIIEITPETFTIEYRITSNSPNRPIGASRNYRSEPKEGVTDIKKDFNDPKNIQVRGTNFTVQSGEFMDQVYGDAASVAEGEFKFRPTETDAPGMQARPDGYLKEAKKSKYITVNGEDDYQLNSKAIEAYLKSVIDPKEIERVDVFMNASKGYGESSKYFFNNYTDNFWKYDNPAKSPDNVIEDWVKQEMSYYFFNTPDSYPSKKMSEDKEEMEESINFHHLMQVRAGIIK